MLEISVNRMLTTPYRGEIRIVLGKKHFKNTAEEEGCSFCCDAEPQRQMSKENLAVQYSLQSG